MKPKIHIRPIISVLLLWSALALSCSERPLEPHSSENCPPIFPDYKEITVPVNIAPLNFRLEPTGKCKVLFSVKDYQFTLSVSDYVNIPLTKWRRLLSKAQGDKVTVTIYTLDHDGWTTHRPFYWHVSPDPIDSHLVYRLIEPTYANWNEMGIYQRELSSFSEKEIIANDKTGHNCMNCHSFNQGDPDQMVLHMRKINPGTILVKDGSVVKLDTKTEHTISNFVYPYWHPSGKDIAFSTNNTQMSFFEANNKLIEVYDLYSDIVLYNTDKNEVYTSPLLSDKEQLENFPVFSPDGKKLYFCSCPRVDSLPQEFARVKYRLCSIDFNVDRQEFASKVDTLVDLVSKGKGVSLPSVSPDGRYILCSVASCGCFLSWDKESDLYLYDTRQKSFEAAKALNTGYSESYTNWSSNSRWIVFSSRRLDGVYNRPFIAHIGENGEIGKPFLLPQKNPDYYQYLFKAYNLPQLVKGAVKVNPHEIAETTKSVVSKQVKFRTDGHIPSISGKPENKSEVN